MKTIQVTDINKFYKNIFWYKKPWYNNTKFETSIDDNELKYAIEALNIKKRNKRIEFTYDAICKLLDDYYKDENICHFCNNKCQVQTGNSLKYTNGCCRLCKHQSSKGCTTANITCKLFYCSSVKEHNKTITLKDLKILKLFSLRQKSIVKHDFFVSRETMLKDLYLGGIIIFTFKTIFRLRYIRKQTKKTS